MGLGAIRVSDGHMNGTHMVNKSKGCATSPALCHCLSCDRCDQHRTLVIPAPRAQVLQCVPALPSHILRLALRSASASSIDAGCSTHTRTQLELLVLLKST